MPLFIAQIFCTSLVIFVDLIVRGTKNRPRLIPHTALMTQIPVDVASQLLVGISRRVLTESVNEGKAALRERCAATSVTG